MSLIVNRYLKSTIFCLVASVFGGLAPVDATAQPQSQTPIMDSAELYQSSVARLYRVRILLEDRQLWDEAYEILRDILKNDDTLNEVSRKKVKRASKIVLNYLPDRIGRRVFNGRHLVRPFIEAQYLINEAIMDARVALNSSSDSEVRFVESLLKSYLAPGFEGSIDIIYPEESTFSFDLYALTAENLSKAKREASDDEIVTSPDEGTGVPPPLPSPGPGDGDQKPEEPIDLLRSSSVISRLSMERRLMVESGKLSPQDLSFGGRGFIRDLIDAGVGIHEVSKEVEKLMEEFSIPDRKVNRYLNESLLLQAIAEPGSAILDPQIQDFVRNVRVKMLIDEATGMSPNEVTELRAAMGSAMSQDADGSLRINMERLFAMERIGTHTTQELVMEQVSGSGRTALYVLSGIGGEDLMRLRGFQAAALLLKDAQRFERAASVVGQTQSFARIVETAGRFAHAAADLGKSASSPLIARLAGAGIRFVGAVGGPITSGGGKILGRGYHLVRDNPLVKNGTLFKALVIANVAVTVTVGAIEYSATTDEDRKYEIYVDAHSRVSATLAYLIPYVGWGLALVDLAHATTGFPYETADLVRGLHRGTYAGWLYVLYGETPTSIEVKELKNQLGIPVMEAYLTRHVRNLTSVELCDSALISLAQDMQNITVRYLGFVYIAHRSFASTVSNRYGRELEIAEIDFAKQRGVFANVQRKLRIARAENLVLNTRDAATKDSQP